MSKFDLYVRANVVFNLPGGETIDRIVKVVPKDLWPRLPIAGDVINLGGGFMAVVEEQGVMFALDGAVQIMCVPMGMWESREESVAILQAAGFRKPFPNP